MQVTYFGHSCFQVESAGTKILFDPFIRPNPLASSVKFNEIKPDVVAISHGHADHIMDAEDIIKASNATFFTNWEIVNWLQAKGCEKGHPMNTGGSVKANWGKISLTPALHSSSFPDGGYAGSANGIVITFPEKTFYFAGDTDLFSDMTLIADKYKPEFSFLPIGDNFTMDAESAAAAARLLGTSTVVGMHFDTFPYIKIDHEKTRNIFSKKGIDLILPVIGETFTL
ncbi:MAG: metal-dependent hydrolase [Bacteroidetes bacterium]|nr:metal-dependent hydrolase [Bacteroidota bacterium]